MKCGKLNPGRGRGLVLGCGSDGAAAGTGAAVWTMEGCDCGGAAAGAGAAVWTMEGPPFATRPGIS